MEMIIELAFVVLVVANIALTIAVVVLYRLLNSILAGMLS